MRIVATDSVWAVVIIEVLMIYLGFLGLVLLPMLFVKIGCGILFMAGLVILLWTVYIYSTTRNHLIEHFSVGPICGSSNILVKQSWGAGIDDVHETICLNCGAKWIVKTSGWTGKIKTVKLVKPSNNGAGREYIGKETDPEFWITVFRERLE